MANSIGMVIEKLINMDVRSFLGSLSVKSTQLIIVFSSITVNYHTYFNAFLQMNHVIFDVHKLAHQPNFYVDVEICNGSALDLSGQKEPETYR